MRRALSALLCVLPLLAQEGAPKPTAHHLAMKAMEGTWDAVVKTYGAPGQPPTESKAVEVNKVVGGGFWMQSDFSGNLMGGPFDGHGLFGFDPVAGKHVGTWVDSVSPVQAITSGTCKDGCKELASTFDMTVAPGMTMNFRELAKQTDADHRTMAMWMAGKDGKEMLMMEIAYTRRK
jgi:hypothetical protein